jgi:hypothetical protein
MAQVPGQFRGIYSKLNKQQQQSIMFWIPPSHLTPPLFIPDDLVFFWPIPNGVKLNHKFWWETYQPVVVASGHNGA